MLTVVARYIAKAETADTVAALLPRLAEKSRTEDGNLSYTISRDLERPEQFIMVETYRTAEDFAVHRGSEHFQEVALGKIVPLLEDRQVTTFEATA